MKRKTLFFVSLSLAGALAVAVFMKIQADHARAESDRILREFKTIDNNLQQSNDSIRQLNAADTSR